MKKLYAILMCGIMLTFVGKSHAEITYGISAAFTNLEADGSETEGGEVTNKSIDHQVIIPSLFVEYAYSDMISVGLDVIPMSADVSENTRTRSDVETSVTSTTTTTSTSRTQKAQAELKNHVTLYGHYNVTDTSYIKAGVAFVTLETTESLGTGSKYGNADIFGGVIGVGMSEGPVRFELVYTDYEDVSLTSSVARTGVSPNNKIEAELDSVALKLSYAF